jgi:tRNA modification GTPase
VAQPLPAVSALADAESHSRGRPCRIAISARTGAGLDELRQHLDRLAFARSSSGTVALNARHVQLITDAVASLTRAREGVTNAAELLALELRESLDTLGAVLGHITPDDVLGRVFATFCVGK